MDTFMIPRNPEARFEITNRCHYDCAICVKNKLTRPRGMMDLATFRRLLDKILDECDWIKTVSFAGMGAPLSNPDIVDIVRHVDTLGLEPILVTNGDLLTPDLFARLQDAGLRSVRVSFHGITPEGYSRLHGVESSKFYKVKSQLDDIFTIKDRTKILMTLVIMKGINEGPVEDWIAMWEGKADLIEAWTAHNWVNQLNNRAVQGERVRTCGRIEHGPLQIQVDGTINACCFDWDGKLTYGDLNKQTLSEIFSSESYARILHAHQTGDHAGLICEHCDQRNASKADALIYSSKYPDKVERVKMTSTCYEKVVQ